MSTPPTGIFEREAKFMLWSAIAFIAIALIASLFGPYVIKQIKNDSCLDSGGSYNYQTNECINSPTK
jgi:hypothetical protein